MSEWKKVFETNISLYCRIIIQYLIKSGWKCISIDDYTKKMPDFPVKEAVLSKLYKKEGLFPIVSQSKDLISGFSDDEKLLNKISEPIIIFGDHTQVVKYIDFDFVLGADGTKILTVTNDYNPKFLYYLIKSINLHSNKYARHYSKLRKEKIPFQENSLSLQIKIVSFLDSLENNNISDESYFDKETEQKILSLQKNSLNIQLIEKEIESQKNYIKQLRQNILQDAIEGKLSANWRKSPPVIKGNPDYDAEALFEQIQKERNNEKKQKELSPITDEEKPFEIPEGWKWIRLGEICNKIEAGKSILCNEKIPSNDEVGIVKTGVCSFGKFKENESKTCLSKNDWHDEYEIKRGDFLIGRANTLELVGSCVIVDSINKKLMLSDKILRIVFCNFVNHFFILYMMKSKFLRSQIEKSSTGSSPTMKNISQESIKNYVLPLPSLKEQEEIVKQVEKHLQTISDLENQITEREQLAKQLMQSILKDAFEER